MIKINKIFFLDSITHGQFGKLNLVGLIPTRTISVPTVPYHFTSYILVLGESDEIPKDISLKLDFYDYLGKLINSQVLDLEKTIPEITQSGSTPYQLFLILPIVITVESPCGMDITIVHKNDILYKESFAYEIGDAPSLKTKSHLPVSKVFSDDETGGDIYIQKLLGSAHKELKIFDTYATPQSLLEILSEVDHLCKINVLTLPKSKSLFLQDALIFKKFPNLIIKYSEKIHDRFIVINNSEYYHFGHSLKDLNKGKLSRMSKVTDKKESEKLELIFSSLWKD